MESVNLTEVCERTALVSLFPSRCVLLTVARLLMTVLGIDDRSQEAWEMAFLLNRS